MTKIVANDGGGCAAKSCVYVEDPVAVSIRRVKERDESDAKFLKKLISTTLTKENHRRDNNHELLISAYSSSLSSTNINSSVEFERKVSDRSCLDLDERFACRQRYLRSYTFGNNCKDKGRENNKWTKLSHWLALTQPIRISASEKKKKKKRQRKGPDLWKDCVNFLLSCTAKVDALPPEEIKTF